MDIEALKKEIYFPYSKIRDVQVDMISDVYSAIKQKKHIIMHAPTGIGKTIASLSPAISFALKQDLTIFFLTSRQTQHKIVIDTLRDIRKSSGIKLECADIIGKKWMCLQGGVESMASATFHEYCKILRDEGKCNYYSNTRESNSQPTFNAKLVLEELKPLIPNAQELIGSGIKNTMCPYEMAALIGGDAKIIVADYYYIFNPPIRQGFLTKTRKELEKIILIIDEAHNLPNRIRDILTQKTSSHLIENAKNEAEKFHYPEIIENLDIIENAMFEIAKEKEIEYEDVISRSDLVDGINKSKSYSEIFTELSLAGEDIRDKQKKSFVAGIARFLEAWLGGDAGFGRILSKSYDRKPNLTLTYRCLTPAVASKEIFDKVHCSVLMSGTLTPTTMYKDILGFGDGVIEKEYKSPFPSKNQLNLIIPRTTTRFRERSKIQYDDISIICSEISNLIAGNVAIFFPSYELMHNISEQFRKECSKPIFMERQKMTKEEKENLLLTFKNHRAKGSVLLGVSTGSFGEGIDMPNVLKAVIIVGLPLQKPDAETKLLVEYYDDKFGRGFEYGYFMPAITKCMQNAGRCIRSETDKGAIIFLDERYATSSYYDCFPEEWDMTVEQDYLTALKEFFGLE